MQTAMSNEWSIDIASNSQFQCLTVIRKTTYMNSETFCTNGGFNFVILLISFRATFHNHVHKIRLLLLLSIDRCKSSIVDNTKQC